MPLILPAFHPLFLKRYWLSSFLVLSNWILQAKILNIGKHANCSSSLVCFCLFLSSTLHTSFYLDKSCLSFDLISQSSKYHSLIASIHTNRILDLKTLGKLSIQYFPNVDEHHNYLGCLLERNSGLATQTFWIRICMGVSIVIICFNLSRLLQISNLWMDKANIYPHLIYSDTKEIPRSKAICPRSQI